MKKLLMWFEVEAEISDVPRKFKSAEAGDISLQHPSSRFCLQLNTLPTLDPCGLCDLSIRTSMRYRYLLYPRDIGGLVILKKHKLQ